MPRVLVFGRTIKPIADALKSVGHTVSLTQMRGDEVDAGDTICRAFDGRPPDLMVVDIREAADCLPVRHLRWLLRDTWGVELHVPCLGLIGPHHLRLSDLPAHIDSFVLPPHDPMEVVARAGFLLYKAMHLSDGDIISFADITLELDSYTVRDHLGKLLPLTPRELELLRFLCIHRGRFFDRDRLLSLVWGVDYEGADRTVDIHICRLRNKLPPQAASLLETVRGVGYGFKVPG